MHRHLWGKWLRQDPEYQLPDPLSDCAQPEGLCKWRGEDYTRSWTGPGGKILTCMTAVLDSAFVFVYPVTLADNQLRCRY